MTEKFGWCLDGHHSKCPIIAGHNGDYEAICSCTCHLESEPNHE